MRRDIPEIPQKENLLAAPVSPLEAQDTGGCWTRFDDGLKRSAHSPALQFFASLIEAAATLCFIFISLHSHWSLLLFKIALCTTLSFHVLYSCVALGEACEEGETSIGWSSVQSRRSSWEKVLLKIALALPFINHLVAPFILRRNGPQAETPLSRDTAHHSIAWCCLQSFSQYIICLSYALDGGELSWPWILALSVSGISLLLGPFHAISRQEATKHHGYLQIFFSTFLWFFPIIALEVIHFFPLLFAYLYYHSISADLFVKYLLAFNIPKAVFLLVCVAGRQEATESGQRLEYRSHFILVVLGSAAIKEGAPKLYRRCCSQDCFGVVVFVFIGSLILVAVPLVPTALLLALTLAGPLVPEDPHPDRMQSILEEIMVRRFTYRWNLCVLVFYMCFAYGSLLHLTIFTKSSGWIVDVSVYTTLGIVAIIVMQHLTLKFDFTQLQIQWMCAHADRALSIYGEVKVETPAGTFHTVPVETSATDTVVDAANYAAHSIADPTKYKNSKEQLQHLSV